MKIATAALAAFLVTGLGAPALGDEDDVPRNLERNAPAAVVQVRNLVVVNSDMIRLGDLFSNVPGDQARINVAYAPEPGKQATFDAGWLGRVARSHKLDWRPVSKLDRSVVERDAIAIDPEEVRDRVLSALIDKGAPADSLVELSNNFLKIYVPSDATAALVVEDVIYDQRSGRFTAIVAAPPDDPRAKRVRVTGQTHKMAEVPVLSHRVLPGEIIAEKDLQWIQTRADRMGADVITEPGSLIGRTPRSNVRAGVPVRLTEVQRPVLVTQNSLVTMILRAPQMMLTAKGRALDNGADGDTVRVSNSQSNTVVEAVVTGTGMVSVRPMGHALIN